MSILDAALWRLGYMDTMIILRILQFCAAA